MRHSIFTWHVHGSYLYYLSQGHYDIYIPVRDARDEGYYGRGHTFPFGDNVHEIPFGDVKHYHFDCILFQSAKNYLTDQYEVLSAEQRSLPKIYLEHNTPHTDTVNQQHVVDDLGVLLVHVTHYNKLMWNNNRTPVTVISHGVTDTVEPYCGDIPGGLVTINHLQQRGRTLGWDIYQQVSREVPLELAGMGNAEGIGEILHPALPSVRSHYRFYFHPVRHTSLALAVCEAMMQGLPVVALATTELVTIIRDGVNGYIHTDVDYLIEKMQLLINDRDHALELGAAARQTALALFDIGRFTREWEAAFSRVVSPEWQSGNLFQRESAVV
ncbi:glycosyltransferase family 4 protein [Chitinophaga oryzae]|uniref:Glycosyltransferase family 4 protein n=1 Tax=Chitinophaga oryzae TaxID=2725414 RepID=A0AAE7D5H6_9BACT|nr:glycosyltransferase [Chitinophaga oryzae]QJB30074.1 glycosyltransferase family 4 protein [Chitinophaga oryzae]